MPAINTPRLQIPVVQLADAADIDVALQPIANIVDTLAVFKQNTEANLPAVGTVPPGTLFQATDSGKQWVSVNPGNPTSNISTAWMPFPGPGTVINASIATSAVDSSKVLDRSLTEEDITSAFADKLGVSQSGIVRAGKAIIPATETRNSNVFGLMTTPDRVQSIVLPTDGWIAVLYHATWQSSNNGQGEAAIFLTSNEVKIQAQNNTGPSPQSATGPGGTAGVDQPLASGAQGLQSGSGTVSVNPDVTTGQIVGFVPNTLGVGLPGGPCYIFANAGTYDVSVQYRAGLGTVTAKNRHLWVWTRGF